jgi:hypothetical protein
MKLVGANGAAKAFGGDELPGKSNYFIGNDPKKWRTNVPTYAKVRYKDVYPGIDLVYHGNQRQLEYDFVVAPGADPKVIQLAVAAMSPSPNGGLRPPLRVDANGDLVVATEGGEVRFHKPIVYQSAEDGVNRDSKLQNRKLLDGHYLLTADNRIHFEILSYDKSKPLVIDPVLIYSTYLGGSGSEEAWAIAVDSSGNAYVAGATNSVDFPTMNPVQGMCRNCTGGGANAFVTKLSATGSALVYSTYLGGTYPGDEGLPGPGGDGAVSIAVDSSGSAYVAGWTYSTDFPTVNAVQAFNAGLEDAFVAKLGPAGNALVYSTYLGGSGNDLVSGIAADSSGNAYVAGYTGSTDFPTLNPIQPAYAGGVWDAFVTKFSTTGALVYSTYLGGSGDDVGFGIAVDSSGNAYVAGATSSTNFPTMNPLQAANAGNCDVFVAKLNAAGSALVYSTYLGGSGNDGYIVNVGGLGVSIAVDSSGNAYVAGGTESTDFPTVNPIQPAYAGGSSDAFVAEINAAGSALVYSTYLGGSGQDAAWAIAVDSSGNAYVAGYTGSTDFPTLNPIQPAFAGGVYDAFVAEINAGGSALVYSTYLGGTGYDYGFGMAVDSAGNAYVAGYTTSTDFPTMNPLQPAYAGGNGDAFVAKLSPLTPGVTLPPSGLTFPSQLIDTTSPSQSAQLTSSGTGPLTIASITISGDFALATTGTSCPYTGGTLASTGICTIDVTFTPLATGPLTGSVTITDNSNGVNGSQQVITLSGTGTNPGVSLSSTSLAFGYVVLNNTSAAMPVLLTSAGTTNLSISSLSITGANAGDFAQTNNCPSSMAPGTRCVLYVTFTPSTLAAESATLDVNDDAIGSPQTIAFSGTGGPAAVLSPASGTFGTVAIDVPSPSRNLILQNNQSVALGISSITLSNPDFTETNTCGSSVAAKGACSISVTLTPSVLGLETATLTVNDNAAAPFNALSSSLSGTGIAQTTVGPTSLTFAPQSVGTSSAPMTVTLKNSLLQALAFSSITITGADPADFTQTNTCGSSVPANSGCVVSVTFRPTATGTRTATLNLNDAANNSPQTISLTGTGR